MTLGNRSIYEQVRSGRDATVTVIGVFHLYINAVTQKACCVFCRYGRFVEKSSGVHERQMGQLLVAHNRINQLLRCTFSLSHH